MCKIEKDDYIYIGHSIPKRLQKEYKYILRVDETIDKLAKDGFLIKDIVTKKGDGCEIIISCMCIKDNIELKYKLCAKR